MAQMIESRKHHKKKDGYITGKANSKDESEIICGKLSRYLLVKNEVKNVTDTKKYGDLKVVI